MRTASEGGSTSQDSSHFPSVVAATALRYELLYQLFDGGACDPDEFFDAIYWRGVPGKIPPCAFCSTHEVPAECGSCEYGRRFGMCEELGSAWNHLHALTAAWYDDPDAPVATRELQAYLRQACRATRRWLTEVELTPRLRRMHVLPGRDRRRVPVTSP